MKFHFSVLIYFAFHMTLSDAGIFDWLFGKQNEGQVESYARKIPIPRSINRTASTKYLPMKSVKKMGDRRTNSTIIPTKHSFDEVFTKRMRESIAALGHLTRVLFIGDSVLFRLSKNATIWHSLENKYAAIMLACPGDRTENILHRFTAYPHLFNISTKPLIILSAGMSNIIIGNSSGSVFNGIVAVVNAVKKKFFQSKIILLSLLPRISKAYNARVNDINLKLSKLYSNTTRIKFLDMTSSFEVQNQTLQNPFLTSDIYPNALGYEILLKLLEPYLSQVKVINRPLPSLESYSKKVYNHSVHHNMTVKKRNITSTNSGKAKNNEGMWNASKVGPAPDSGIVNKKAPKIKPAPTSAVDALSGTEKPKQKAKFQPESLGVNSTKRANTNSPPKTSAKVDPKAPPKKRRANNLDITQEE